jgi:hypothetical protein
MEEKRPRPSTETSQPKNTAKSGESPDFQIDVDEALIDDKHPKDTIQGGPAGQKRPSPPKPPTRANK